MMLRCPSCGVRLRLKDETMAAGSAAKCPKCSATVPLKAEDDQTIKVQCASCGVRLKAPAASLGSRSACPRCKAEVAIGESMSTSLAARTRQEDSSGASTRRMDSRTLGLPGLGAQGPSTADIDLDAFVKSAENQIVARETLEGFQSPNLATSLMHPPVKELGRLATEIRSAAASFDPAAARSAATGAESPEPPTVAAREPQPQRTARMPQPQLRAQAFPAARGLMLGGAAGLLVGGVSAAAVKLAGPAALNYVVPLPLSGVAGGLPDVTLQVALPGLLGSIAGFIAAAAGSPTVDDRPLRLLRTLGFSLLAGLACGLVTGLSSPEGLSAWPIASWVRDLVAVGVLTSALHSLVPQTRS